MLLLFYRPERLSNILLWFLEKKMHTCPHLSSLISNSQLCSPFMSVGLTSAFLNEAEEKTVIRFVHSEVLEAVSHQSQFVIPVSVVRPRYSAHILSDRLLLLSSNYAAWVKKKLHCDTFLDFAQKEVNMLLLPTLLSRMRLQNLFVSFNILGRRRRLLVLVSFFLFFFILFYFSKFSIFVHLL